MYKNVVVRPHWSTVLPDAVRGMLRDASPDPITRLAFCAGVPVVLAFRKSGLVQPVACHASDAERAAAAMGVVDTGWVADTVHRVVCARDAARAVTALTLHVREHVAGAARDAIALACSSEAHVVAAIGPPGSGRSCFVRAAAYDMHDCVPVVRDLDGDVFCGRPPARHAVVLRSGGNLFDTARAHGSTAVMADGCAAGDGVALARIAANGALCIIACDCGEPELVAMLAECTRLDVRVVRWDVDHWKERL